MSASLVAVIAASNRAIAVSSRSRVVRGVPYAMVPSAFRWLIGTPEHQVSAKNTYVIPARVSISARLGSECGNANREYWAAAFSADVRA